MYRLFPLFFFILVFASCGSKGSSETEKSQTSGVISIPTGSFILCVKYCGLAYTAAKGFVAVGLAGSVVKIFYNVSDKNVNLPSQNEEYSIQVVEPEFVQTALGIESSALQEAKNLAVQNINQSTSTDARFQECIKCLQKNAGSTSMGTYRPQSEVAKTTCKEVCSGFVIGD